MTDIYIEDGYTLTATIPAVTGIHPAVVVKYRPALPIKRVEHGVVIGTGSAAKVADLENDLIARHVIGLEVAGHDHPGDGPAVRKDQAAKMKPTLRNSILNLVLGYTGADEGVDAGNCAGG